jgi:hypothetical protein
MVADLSELSHSHEFTNMQHIQNEHPMTSDPAVGSGDWLDGEIVT